MPTDQELRLLANAGTIRFPANDNPATISRMDSDEGGLVLIQESPREGVIERRFLREADVVCLVATSGTYESSAEAERYFGADALDRIKRGGSIAGFITTNPTSQILVQTTCATTAGCPQVQFIRNPYPDYEY